MRMRALVLMTCLATASTAQAAMMHHHDLASLAFMSDAVVKVRRVGAFDRVTRVRITEVYQGSLRVGTNMDLPTSIYSLSGTLGGTTITPGETMFVFLTQRDGAWTITPSGLRVLDASGHVQRFVQISNPGPYGVAPQGVDPLDVQDELQQSAPVDVAAFEGMLRRALRRADAVKAALQINDAAARRSAVLRLMPAPRSYLFAPQSFYFYNDALADRIAKTFGEANDLRGTLEVWSRMHGDRMWSRSVLRRRAPEVLAIALSATEPEHLRTTALRTVFELGNLPSEGDARAVLGLLDDASAEIRGAALAALDDPGRVQSSEASWPATQRAIRRMIRDALHDRWGRESEAAVRVQMLRSREIWRVTPRRVGRFAFAATRVGNVVSHQWARRDNGAGIVVEVLSGDTACTLDADRTSGWHGGVSGGGAVVPTSCPRPWTIVARDEGREVARVTVE